MRRALRGPALFLAVVAALGACGEGDDSSDASTTSAAATSTSEQSEAVTETETSVIITITGLSFPDLVEVPSGKSVIWVNDSSAPHEIEMEAHDGSPADVESVRIGPDQEGEMNLDPGSWDYVCTIHPSMTGSLSVGG